MPIKPDQAAGLIEVLREELAVYCNLADFLKRQRDCVVRRDIDDLQMSIDEEQSLIEQTERIASARHSAAEALALSLGRTDGSSARLSDFIPLLAFGEAATLNKLREDLRSTVDSISELTATNRFLMSHALHMASKRLAILEGVEDGDIVYAETGRRDPADQSKLNVIDRRI